MRLRPALLLVVVACGEPLTMPPPPPPPPATPDCSPAAHWKLRDRFCRDLGATGLKLLDWDGQLANPAVPVTLVPPMGLTLPVHVAASSDAPRLFFDLGGREERAFGMMFGPPSASVDVADAGQLAFRIAIWPDRDGADEDHTLHLVAGGESLDVAVHVVDQDLARDGGWPIPLDYSHDDAGFFDDAQKRAVVQQAASDWSYFFDGTGLDPVAAGAEQTFVDGPQGWEGPRPLVTNAAGYTGFLLYAVGMHTSEDRSTGYPTKRTAFQSRAGVTLPGNLCRSGSLEIDVNGNYGSPGWSVSLADDDWYRLDNRSDVPTDLASIVHHEVGHALFFDEQYARFMPLGTLSSDAIVAYAGKALPIDATNHFDGVLDPASGFGAFGNEYAATGTMPYRRWIITKLDLLAAQAIGYPLRTGLSPFFELSLDAPALPQGKVGAAYHARLAPQGGVPPYGFFLDGQLPAGLYLDALSGELTGAPTAAGKTSFAVRVEDQLGAALTRAGFAISVLP